MLTLKIALARTVPRSQMQRKTPGLEVEGVQWMKTVIRAGSERKSALT